jgi:hypothetical protein
MSVDRLTQPWLARQIEMIDSMRWWSSTTVTAAPPDAESGGAEHLIEPFTE